MRRILAATLLLSPLVHAADAPPSKKAEAPPLMVQALTAATHELTNAIENGDNLNKTFAALATFSHSPETVKLLTEAFGDARPWSIEQRGIDKGRTSYQWLLKPLQQTTPAGGTLAWSGLPVDFGVDKSGKLLDYRGDWSSLSFEDKTARMMMARLGFNARQRRGAGNIWYGDMRGTIDSIVFEGKDSPLTIAMRGMDFNGKVVERARTVDMTQSFGIKSIEAAGEQVDDFRVALRVLNIDKAALVAMRAAEKKMSAQQVASKDDLSAMMPLFKAFARGATAHKTAVHLDEFSLRFHGHQAMMRGRIGLDPVPGNKVGDLPGLVKYINARLIIKVPVALVREVALAIARQQAAAASKAQPLAPSQDAAALGQSIADAMIGKLLGNGYARLENDVLVSSIEFRGGVLRMNGKKIDLPAPGQPADPAKLTTFMQARRITDSCTLPDYPAQIVAQDAPLALTLQFVVDPEGRLHELNLAEASGNPDYDSAVLAAFGACRFIPALQNGKPVQHAMTHTLTREPGSVRP